MEIYLRHHNIPEFANLDKGQRSEIWAATAGRRLRDPFSLLGLVVLIAVVAVCYTGGSFLIPLPYGGAIGGGIGAGLGNVLAFGIMTPRARPYLAAEIESKGW